MHVLFHRQWGNHFQVPCQFYFRESLFFQDAQDFGSWTKSFLFFKKCQRQPTQIYDPPKNSHRPRALMHPSATERKDLYIIIHTLPWNPFAFMNHIHPFRFLDVVLPPSTTITILHLTPLHKKQTRNPTFEVSFRWCSFSSLVALDFYCGTFLWKINRARVNVYSIFGKGQHITNGQVPLDLTHLSLCLSVSGWRRLASHPFQSIWRCWKFGRLVILLMVQKSGDHQLSISVGAGFLLSTVS